MRGCDVEDRLRRCLEEGLPPFGSPGCLSQVAPGQGRLQSAGLPVVSEIAKRRNKDFNVYTFYFNHAPPGRNTEFYGSFHSSDLWYFMDSIRENPGQRFWTDADYRMADTMSSYLANFVKTGNPNGKKLPEWPQATHGKFMRFHDGYAMSAKHTPYPERDELNRETVMRIQKLGQETKLKQ
ncbi:carboxylesterase family protein [Agrobacterium tumefaciens]|uniref:carboxylesterase family protein n=1 Tax=Agrobacterium tumefaciens TaxID=358 RepID=UPI002B1BD9F5|nr:carboxylesterase family protein [Agrobacterium tumefaciens]